MKPTNLTSLNTRTLLKHAIALLSVASVAYSAAALAVGDTLSIGSKTGDQNDYAATNSSSLSADGRYIVVSATKNWLPVAVVYDRFTKTSQEVTTGTIYSTQAKLAANGQSLAFISASKGITSDDNNDVTQVYWYDLRNKTTKLISKSNDGASSNQLSAYPSISADGKSVVFMSQSDNLVANDTNNLSDIFLRDLRTSKTTRINVSSSGAQGDLGVTVGKTGISADGRYVVFSSSSSNLVTGDDTTEDVFLRDVKAGLTTRISGRAKSSGWDGNSRYPSISSDGRYIAYQSASSKLIANDTDDTNSDIFVFDRSTKTTTKITKNANGMSVLPTISGNGRFIAFISQASNLVTNDTNEAWDTFVYDQQTGKTERINLTPQGEQSVGDAMHYSLIGVDLSADGRFVSFESGAADLTPDDTDKSSDVFLRDRLVNKQKSADIKISATAPTSAVKNQQYTYLFTVTNQGPASASQTNAIINLPGSLTIDAVVPAQGSCAKGLVTVCQIGTLNSGASKQIQVKVKALAAGFVNVSASAQAVEKETVYSNNAVSKGVTIK